MKSFKLFIGSVIAIVCLVVSGSVLTSCTNDDDQLLAGDSQTERISSTEYTSGIDDIIQYLSNCGFSTDNVELNDSLLIFENDIAFGIPNFWEQYSMGNMTTRAHYRTHYIVSSSHRNILVQTPASTDPYALPLNWLTGLVYAVDAWNNLGGPIHFTLWSGDPHNATIQVQYMGFANSPSTIAIANFPQLTGIPGPLLLINSNNSSVPNMSNTGTTSTLIHELGHTIGFAHTDQTPASNDITKLNTSDADTTDIASVMQPTGYQQPPYFSSCDIEAYHLLYNW